MHNYEYVLSEDYIVSGYYLFIYYEIILTIFRNIHVSLQMWRDHLQITKPHLELWKIFNCQLCVQLKNNKTKTTTACVHNIQSQIICMSFWNSGLCTGGWTVRSIIPIYMCVHIIVVYVSIYQCVCVYTGMNGKSQYRIGLICNNRRGVWNVNFIDSSVPVRYESCLCTQTHTHTPRFIITTDTGDYVLNVPALCAVHNVLLACGSPYDEYALHHV